MNPIAFPTLDAGAGAAATVVSAEVSWAKIRAGQELRQAVDSLDTAAAALVGIAADADWESDGVRALQEAIESLRHRTPPVVVGLRARESELEGVPVS